MIDASFAHSRGIALGLESLTNEIHEITVQSSDEELAQVVQDWNSLSATGQMIQIALGTEQSIRAQEAIRESAQRIAK